jgi:hypothetical protein
MPIAPEAFYEKAVIEFCQSLFTRQAKPRLNFLIPKIKTDILSVLKKLPHF